MAETLTLGRSAAFALAISGFEVVPVSEYYTLSSL